MWAAYRQAADKSVPAPCDADTPHVAWWYDHVASQASTWAELGITAVLLPPPLKSNAGRFIGADGYGVFDDYDIGSKNQFYSVETRFGSAEQLRRCIATCHANGLDVYVDMVPHQRMGGSNGVYEYLGADGKTKNGRFPKQPSYFRGDAADGRVPEDPVPVPADDFSFGDELCPINATPKGAVMTGLLDAGNWLFRTLGVQGARLDDTKGMASEFVNEWANHGAMAGKVIVGEYADGNPDNLNWWVWNQTDGRCQAFDFSTHYAVEGMCNNTSNWNMEQLRDSFADMSPSNAVTMVESPDTDTDGFATIVWNKAAAYHWVASRTGYPVAYYKDWSDDAGCYGGGGLQPHINNSIWLQAKLANGEQVERYATYQVYAIERLGAPGLLSAINNDEWSTYTITVQTAFGAGVWLHDYTGHAPDVCTDAQGMATITVPRNDNGLGTVGYSRQGIAGEIQTFDRQTEQVLFGAADLDIGPIVNGTLQVGRVWCALHSLLSVTLTPDQTGWGNGVDVAVHIEDKVDFLNMHGYDDQDASHTQGASFKVQAAGWHTLSIVAAGMPADGSPFELKVDYTAPRGFTA
nr:hypothetical protein [uncultured Lichenicoccus sp.]